MRSGQHGACGTHMLVYVASRRTCTPTHVTTHVTPIALVLLAMLFSWETHLRKSQPCRGRSAVGQSLQQCSSQSHR